MATTVWAEHALTADGWCRHVAVGIDADGRIESVTADAPADNADRTGLLLPAPANLHSHAFQRAMAGLTEAPGGDGRDSFWTWRSWMYRFLAHLTPDDVEAIAAQVQMEMLEAGYAAVGEFHYLHHQPDGAPYDNPAEIGTRIIAAADTTGIGLTLLPVLYQQGGCDGRPLEGGQRRFGNDPDGYGRLVDQSLSALAALPDDARVGLAPHSLRAVDRDGLAFAVALRPDRPLHIHVAEQVAEVTEVEAAYGARPVTWLLDTQPVDSRWCFVHATQMTPGETEALAASGAVAGLCPITEANLGDGLFDGVRFLKAGGRFGIGSDSNVRIALPEELRLLDYGQRLRDRVRAAMAHAGHSSGRTLYEMAATSGAQALGRAAGRIAPGQWADLVALDGAAIDLIGKSGDAVLDAFVFCGDAGWVTDVWAAGRHVVQDGRHIARDGIEARYRATVSNLMTRL